MNVEQAQSRSTGNHITHRVDDEDENTSLQDALSNTSLHLTDGRNSEHPSIAKLGAALASIEIILMLGLVSAAFALPHVMDEKEAEHFVTVGVYAFLLYSHSGVWLIVFFFDLVFSVHHRKLKMRGFLKFYRSVKYLQRHPFCVKSLFQTIFLVVTVYFSQVCTSISSADCKLFTLTSTMWLQILSAVEAAAMFIGLIIYLGRVYTQNKYRLPPDDAEDQMLTSFQPHNHNTSSGVGYRADSYVDDIIEHQADKIRSLQEQNAVLNRKLYSLASRNGAVTVVRS